LVAALGIHCKVQGEAPLHGLVVANHLSYLDIMFLGANVPCCIVSKQEISRWPFFGMFARMGATIFIDRSSRVSAAAAARTIGERLRLGVPVLLFPEGTSSDGSQVLPFYPTLFEPAVAAGIPVTAASVRYVLEGGGKERDLCWFDDTLFLPHIWKALAARGFFAEVSFGEPRVYPDRRAAAAATRAEVIAMRAGLDPRQPAPADPAEAVLME